MDEKETDEDVGDGGSEYESVSIEYEVEDGSCEDTGAETDDENCEQSEPHATE
jgi:hypothetical protein